MTQEHGREQVKMAATSPASDVTSTPKNEAAFMEPMLISFIIIAVLFLLAVMLGSCYAYIQYMQKKKDEELYHSGTVSARFMKRAKSEVPLPLYRTNETIYYVYKNVRKKSNPIA